MVAPLFRAIPDSDQIRFCYTLEYLTAGLWTNQVSVDFAQMSFIKIINEQMYDSAIGRNLNFRKGEISSVDSYVRADYFYSLLSRPDGDSVLERMQHEKRFTPFFTHDMLLSGEALTSLDLNIKIIEVFRDPISMTYSWIKKSWGSRQITDPRSFKHLISYGGELIPWQAKEISHSWIKASPAERCALTVIWMTRKLMYEFPKYPKHLVLPVFYDNYAENTLFELNRILLFLNKVADSGISEILGSENLPRKLDPQVLQDKIGFLKKEVGVEIFDDLSLLQTQFLEFSKSLSLPHNL